MGAETLSANYVVLDDHHSHGNDIKANEESIDKRSDDALVSELMTTVRRAAIADLLQLFDTIPSIENDFVTVASKMAKIDKNLKKITSVEFAPQWKIIHERYTKLIQNSKIIANKMSNKIDGGFIINVTILKSGPPILPDLVGVYIPLIKKPNVTFEDKKRGLATYINALDSFKTVAEDNSTGFLRLKQHIHSFKNTLKEASNKRRGIKKKVEEIDKQIETLVGKFTLKNLVDTVKNIMTGMSEIRQDILEIEPIFTGMTDKIHAIQGIWQMLWKDSATLSDKLSSMSNEKNELVFELYAKSMEQTYKALQFSLEKYAITAP